MRFPIKSGNLKIATSFILLGLLIAIAFIGALPQFSKLGVLDSSAAATLIQEADGANSSCSTSCSVKVPLLPVVIGEVLAIAMYEKNSTNFSQPTDLLGTSFQQEVSAFVASGAAVKDGIMVQTFVANVTSAGADTVIFNDGSGMGTSIAAAVFVLQGVTTSAAENGASLLEGCASPCDTTYGAPVSFSAGAFLLNALDYTNGTRHSPAGFTVKDVSPSTGNATIEYATSGVSSPTTFPGNVTSSTSMNVNELFLVLQPVPVITETSTVTVTTTATSATTTTVTQTSVSTTTQTSVSTTTSRIFVYPSSTSVHCSPEDSKLGQKVHCTAIVSSRSGGTPTGKIRFSFTDGKDSGTSAPINCAPIAGSPTKCSASIDYKFPVVGQVTIKATYSGDKRHQSSHGVTDAEVTK